MKQHSLIKDNETRKAINDIEKRLERIESIPQLSIDSNINTIVDTINKITDSIKRIR